MYSNTPDNELSLFLRAIKLANNLSIQALGIAEGDLGHGYAGFDHSVERLKAFGWSGNVPIVKFDVGGNVNTLSEARALAKYARGVRGDIGIVAPAFHLVRAFVTTVTALGKEPARVYAIPGVSLPWLQKAAHSQGTLKDTREGLLFAELMRLEKYRAPEFGNMLSAEKVLQYLHWRDC